MSNQDFPVHSDTSNQHPTALQEAQAMQQNQQTHQQNPNQPRQINIKEAITEMGLSISDNEMQIEDLESKLLACRENKKTMMQKYQTLCVQANLIQQFEQQQQQQQAQQNQAQAQAQAQQAQNGVTISK